MIVIAVTLVFESFWEPCGVEMRLEQARAETATPWRDGGPLSGDRNATGTSKRRDSEGQRTIVDVGVSGI